MSTSGINYIYDKLGIRTGAFKIYYDFSGLNGGDVPSVSGAHEGFPASVTGGLNIINNSGSFDRNIYLEPQNIDNSFDPNNWSMFFNYDKKDEEECSLFNSLITGSVPSGFKIGINDANKVYFHYYKSGDPYYYTSDKIIGSKNLLCISKSPNLIEFSYYDFNNKSFETESNFSDDDFLFYSNKFKLFQDFSGHVDDFIYLDGNVSYNNRQRLCSGFFLEPNFLTGRIGVTGYESYQTGHINGNDKVYETGLKLLTGNLNYSNNSIEIVNTENLKQFGQITDNCNISDNLFLYDGVYTGIVDGNKLYPLTGFLETISHISGGHIDPIEISGIQITGYLETDYPIYTGVTGSIQESYINYVDECGRPVLAYNTILLTGILSGESLIPQTGYVTTNLGSGFNFWKSGDFEIQNSITSTPFQPNDDLIHSYGMEFVTYTDGENIGDLQEIIVFPNQQNLKTYNKTPFYDQPNKYFIVDKNYGTGGINLFLNGVLQYQSGHLISGDSFNVILAPQVDYFLSGNNVRSNQLYTNNDLLIYDEGIPSLKKIASFDYSTSFSVSGLFTDFPVFEDDLVFLNGQKLYSGLNYQISGGQWMEPITGFEDSTGNLITIKKYIGERSLTGEYNKFTLTKFPRNTSIYFLNGVRVPRNQYVEHSSIDLISGDNISVEGSENLYNNDGISGFWE